MLPTHTTVATFVLAPSIQVLTALSVVPVFPMCGMPVPVLDALAVPPLNVCCRAYVIAAATSSLTACEHFDAGGVTSLPSAFMILSIAIGVQNRPLFAMPAKAVAMVSGETYSVPSTAAGGNCSFVRWAWRMLNAAGVCLILHRSSCWAMDTNALLTEYFVAARAVFAWVWSSFSGLYCPFHPPPAAPPLALHESLNLVKSRREPLKVSLSECPSLSHSASVNTLNVDPGCMPPEPP